MKNITIISLIVGLVTIWSCNEVTEPEDCAGVAGGEAVADSCGVCDDNPDNDCLKDCANEWGGTAFFDDCGSCTGGNTGLSPNYEKDCNGDCFGEAFENICGCVDGDTGYEVDYCYGCTNSEAENYNPEATIDDGSCGCGVLYDIDGNVYNTVIIGNQCWMRENLKTTHYRNGEVIPTGFNNSDWFHLSIGAYSVYDNNDSNADTNGYLYNWSSVDDSRNIAPEGWHIPTDDEWQTLVDYLGGNNVAGGKLKEAGTVHWGWQNVEATNESGFTALPAGNRWADTGYRYMGQRAYFWTSTEYLNDYAWGRYLLYDTPTVTPHYYYPNPGFSIRCVKD